MGRRRPFRAIAFVPDPTAPNGRRRAVAGRVAACTRDALDPWIARQLEAGNVVDVREDRDLLEELDDTPSTGSPETLP